MREQAIKCNCAAIQQQQQQQQQEQQFNNCMRRKSRKKLNDDHEPSMPTTTTTATTTTATAAATNHSNYYNNYTKVNKLLITTTLLLLLLITMSAAATLFRPASAAALQTSHSLSSSPLSLFSSSSSSSSTPQQQRQLQQQQLFALLTKNRQQQQQQQPEVPTITTTRTTASTTSGTAAGRALLPAPRSKFEIVDDDEDAAAEDNSVAAAAAAAASLETTGFVADDGQQYEKAELALAAATVNNNSNNNNNNNQISNAIADAGGGGGGGCPKECKCLNDYFDCGKKHLERVPELPNYVQILDLVGNKFNDTTVLQIRNLPELHKLSLKRNQLESVPQFTGLVALKQLNLANNRIQRISSAALAALPKLKALDLSKNYLHTLESNYFPQTNRLAHLILNANEIGNIEENAFEHLSDLLDLEMNNNRLATLPAGVFKNLNKLKKLSLNNNHLEINWSTFKGLHALQKLFLRSNAIRALQDGVFHVMRSIEAIELDHNGITSLSRQGLFNLTKLHHLSLSNNSISRIELDTWEFTQSLVSLDLSYNNITDFRPQHLDCLQRLRHLNLGHNKIQTLAEGTFDCVKSLEDLNLRRNKLAWIIEDQGAAPPFKALRKLKKLDLYGNNLKQINSKSLSGLSALESLNLGGNALATVQSGAFEQMLHLQKLIFKSLNFICDCELLWFRRWLQKNNVGGGSTAHSQHSPNAVCGYPEHLLDRELLSLTHVELICVDTPKPTITQEPSNQLAVKGANITMECIGLSPAAASLAAADELKIKWRHDNQNIRERGDRAPALHNHHGGGAAVSSSYSTTETQIHHDQSTNQTTIIGYLRLYNVSYEGAGRYQCVVSNAFGTTYSQKFKISIGIHPSFLQIPSNLTIDSGDTARLVCSAAGDPMPEIALQKFGASDFPAATERRLQVIREENAFVITNAKPIDTGIYTCTAESAAGEIKINASLVVNDKPQPAIPVVRKEIALGESAVLECLSDELVTSSSASAISSADNEQNQAPLHRAWFKDNKPFHTSSTSESERYYFTGERELLVIVNTQSMDAGHYRCDIAADARTHALQIELIVVKEDFSKNVIIVGVVLVTIACMLIGSLIVCTILFYQKRKLYLSAGGADCSIRGVVDSTQAANGGDRLMSGSRGSALDETQLSTLQRSYKPTASDTLTLPSRHTQQRPRSLADFDSTDQQNCLIISCDSYASPAGYQKLLLQQRRRANTDAGNDGDGSAVGGGGGLTLEYLNSTDSSSHHDAAADHNQQDHLSSKDSGTGSDAAVKRSIDDFTLATLLPASALQASTPARASLAKADSYSDDEDEDDDEVNDFAAAHALGISDYENGPLCRDAELDGDDDVEMCEFRGERARFLHHNNNHTNHFDGGGGSRLEPTGPVKCKTSKLSTNFNTTDSGATSQAIDI